MTSGNCSSRCSTRPGSAAANTAMTCAAWGTPWWTSPRPGASGATFRRRSDRGRGSGHSFAAGLATAPASELMLEHLTRPGVTGRLELVLVDRGVTAAAARTLGRHHDVEVRRVGWDDKQPVFRPIRHAWRVEVAHGRLGRCRRLATSFENTTTSATGCSRSPASRLRCATCHTNGLASAESRSRGERPPAMNRAECACECVSGDVRWSRIRTRRASQLAPGRRHLTT
jgi:hypothetical protein